MYCIQLFLLEFLFNDFGMFLNAHILGCSFNF